MVHLIYECSQPNQMKDKEGVEPFQLGQQLDVSQMFKVSWLLCPGAHLTPTPNEPSCLHQPRTRTHCAATSEALHTHPLRAHSTQCDSGSEAVCLRAVVQCSNHLVCVHARGRVGAGWGPCGCRWHHYWQRIPG